MPQDIRDILFAPLAGRVYQCRLTADSPGLLCGMPDALLAAREIGLEVTHAAPEGAWLTAGQEIIAFYASPMQVTLADERLAGCLAKFSGIATAARQASVLAGEMRIVCGAVKKLPHALKGGARQAVLLGGCLVRIAEHPMVYLDKNTVRMHGGIGAALDSVKALEDHTKCVQLKRLFGMTIEAETEEALGHGADILMVDTGDIADARACVLHLKTLGRRSDVRVAFARHITLDQIPLLRDTGVDLLDVGRAVLDAPLLDMSLDVIS